MSDQIILTQIQQLPDALKKEVLDFIGFLLEKQKAIKQSKPSRAKYPKGNKANSELEEAIKIVQAGCDMSSFSDALEYQKTTRQERSLPYRD